ncbi:hypothetical protein Tsubulata_029244 [Turnera subulata]|uniref:HVA22-like protein n=1 Tax=Turnera subulata TaxID=218843 RepID=A0A9Q0GA29_9ROSI|nr:hypothetical protein Tsubulata_029244 [Turnera subulata]
MMLLKSDACGKSCLEIKIYPIWSWMKLLFCLWLVLPIFNGAAYLYQTYMRRYIKLIGLPVPLQRNEVSSTAPTDDEVLSSAPTDDD